MTQDVDAQVKNKQCEYFASKTAITRPCCSDTSWGANVQRGRWNTTRVRCILNAGGYHAQRPSKLNMRTLRPPLCTLRLPTLPRRLLQELSNMQSGRLHAKQRGTTRLRAFALPEWQTAWRARPTSLTAAGSPEVSEPDGDHPCTDHTVSRSSKRRKALDSPHLLVSLFLWTVFCYVPRLMPTAAGHYACKPPRLAAPRGSSSRLLPCPPCAHSWKTAVAAAAMAQQCVSGPGWTCPCHRPCLCPRLAQQLMA